VQFRLFSGGVESSVVECEPAENMSHYVRISVKEKFYLQKFRKLRVSASVICHYQIFSVDCAERKFCALLNTVAYGGGILTSRVKVSVNADCIKYTV
jgi:hypothetical protein